MASIWIIIDIASEPHVGAGWFATQDDARHYIRWHLDSADTREYDKDSMYDEAEVRPATPGETAIEGEPVWISCGKPGTPAGGRPEGRGWAQPEKGYRLQAGGGRPEPDEIRVHMPAHRATDAGRQRPPRPPMTLGEQREAGRLARLARAIEEMNGAFDTAFKAAEKVAGVRYPVGDEEESVSLELNALRERIDEWTHGAGRAYENVQSNEHVRLLEPDHSLVIWSRQNHETGERLVRNAEGSFRFEWNNNEEAWHGWTVEEHPERPGTYVRVRADGRADLRDVTLGNGPHEPGDG